MSDHILVTDWDTIERATGVSERDKQRVATILSEQSWDYVVWIPEWLLDDSDKDVETVEASDHLAVGDVDDYSEKAWQLWQPHRFEGLREPSAFLPKSSVVVFERATGVDAIDTPQVGLTEWS